MKTSAGQAPAPCQHAPNRDPLCPSPLHGGQPGVFDLGRDQGHQAPYRQPTGKLQREVPAGKAAIENLSEFLRRMKKHTAHYVFLSLYLL